MSLARLLWPKEIALRDYCAVDDLTTNPKYAMARPGFVTPISSVALTSRLRLDS
jgi:hypothetical protein